MRKVLTIFLTLAGIGTADAASMAALQGAWTINGTDCTDTFQRVDGKMEFIDRTASVTTGMIMDGSKIIGANATCTAEHIREMEDHFVAYLSCTDSILTSGYSVAFRVLDDKHFERFDSSFPELSAIYHKCD
jgi:hypothetical protein